MLFRSKLLAQRALTAQTALINFQLAAQAHSALQCDLLTLLKEWELSGACRGALVQAVLEYNQSIADYSLSIAPANQPPALIASMLVAPSLPVNSDARSVLAEAPARPANRWAGTQVQPRSIRTMPNDSGNAAFSPSGAGPTAVPAGESLTPAAGNLSGGNRFGPAFGPPPSTGTFDGAPTTIPSGPAVTAPVPERNPAPLAPASSPPNSIVSPPSSPAPTVERNPPGSFAPPATSGPTFGPPPPSTFEKPPTGGLPPGGPPAGSPPSGNGTQFKFGG